MKTVDGVVAQTMETRIELSKHGTQHTARNRSRQEGQRPELRLEGSTSSLRHSELHLFQLDTTCPVAT